MKSKISNSYTIETIILIVLLVLLFLLVNPFNFFMPTMTQMTLASFAVVFFGAFSVMLLREKAVDERDFIHRSHAGRAAFLVGSAVLLLGILTQTYRDSLDPWLVFALVAMIIAKIVSRIYSDKFL